MSWAAPWALIGLAVLPVLWLLHRRRKRPRTVALPSLLFLLSEPTAAPARRQVLDPELWLTVLAATLLVGAAAGPFVTSQEEGRTVAVIVSDGLPAAARGYGERVDAVLARIRSEVGPDDRVLVRTEPPAGVSDLPRPRADALLATAQGTRAAWRVVVSDAPAPADTPGVTWIAVGDPASFNVGIVAAALRPSASGFELFVNVRGDDARPTTVRVRVHDRDTVFGEIRLEIRAGSHASHTFAMGRIGLALRVELTSPDGAPWVDDLPGDDAVAWERVAVPVLLDPALPAALRRVVEDALVASLGRRGWQRDDRAPALRVTTDEGAGEDADGPWTLVLFPAPAQGALRAAPGVDRVRPDALVRDLSTAGTDLVYAPAAAEGPGSALEVALGRQEGGRLWPVVLRSGRVVHFRPDPTRGSPAPAATPLWPLFVDDLLVAVAGRVETGGAGYRRRGVLDDASSALGRTASTWRAPDLALRPADVPARTRSFRLPLAAGAVLALLLLWLVPWSGPAAGRHARRRAVPSAHGDALTPSGSGLP